MPFNGNSPSVDLMQRFSSESMGFEALGVEAWRTLIGRLSDDARDAIVYLRAFDDFMDSIDTHAPSSAQSECRVFVSHQQRDGAYAERIAWIATRHQFDYWLDIHDPTLVLANRTVPPGDPRRGLIIAAIVEIGLLNSTHVIAVHTSNSLSSKWVPYELGRAKARQIRSTQAAGWFDPSVSPLSFGEYVQLVTIAHGGEHGLNTWFALQHASAPVRPGRTLCRPSYTQWHPAIPEPAPLPQ